PGINCFFGKNGEGKTNLLDAIYYLSFCKSHSNPIDSQNITHDADFFVLQAAYKDGELQEEIYCGMKRKQKKVFKRNKKEYERLSDHIGRVPLVLISPADEELIREGSDERRRFMDMVISQYDHAYMDALMSYNKTLQQRNALLKGDTFRDEALWCLYEEMMTADAEVVFSKRTAFIENFTPVFETYYQKISGGKEHIHLTYASHLSEGNLAGKLRGSRQRDEILGYTTVGIHKDDLIMDLDGHPIKRVGSQGQNKSYLIALKLAQFDFLKKAGNKTPILLLDDLFDKLDANRVERIISLVSGEEFGQIFITDTNRENPDHLLQRTTEKYRIFYVENGQIELMES
ncbi:MAG: DNA replication and repair protein RecF, partial [Bacteroidales bacterium]|nr:DNA replication and repair protein RecF [Bacteroidales bacterium]